MPKYEQIANDLRHRIVSGEYPAGSKIPSINELERIYGASMGTVERALEILRSKKLIRTQQGMGSFVQGGIARDEHEIALHNGCRLRVITYDTGTIRIHINQAPYVLSEVSLKGGKDDSVTIELSPGGQGSAAYTGRV